MAHLWDSGFCVRTPSWHQLENLLDDFPTDLAEARKLADIEWEPISVPVYNLVGVDEQGAPRYEEVKDFYSIARSDNGKVLSVPRNSYSIITNAEAFELEEALLEQDRDHLKRECLLSLDEGRRVVSLIRLDEPISLNGDSSEVLPYFAVVNSHDGTTALRAEYTYVRIVCANTQKASEIFSDNAGTVYTFSHTKNWKEKVEEAKAALTGLRERGEEFKAWAQYLLDTPITPEQTKIFLGEFIPNPAEHGVAVTDRVANNIEEARKAVYGYLNGSTNEEIKGTAWGLVQAGFEWAEHGRRSHNPTTHLKRAVLGTYDVRQKCVEIVHDLVAA